MDAELEQLLDSKIDKLLSSLPETAFFDELDSERFTHTRRLPHWHQDNTLVFITFRLADSLPQKILEEIKAEKEIIMKFGNIDVKKANFIEKADEWLNANYGSCCLEKPENRIVVENALHHFDGQRYKLHAYVVMGNHVHVLIQLFSEFSLSKITHSWKSFTSHIISKNENMHGPLWQTESYDSLIRNHDHYRNVVKYIFNNRPSDAWIRDE